MKTEIGDIGREGLRLGLVALLICSAGVSSPLIAQTLQPGAIGGELLKQQEREMDRRRMSPDTSAEPVLEGLPSRGQAPATGGDAHFVLRRVLFSESAILSPEQLQTTVEPYLGRQIGFAELQALLDDVNRLYDARGFATARAILPPQKVSEGVLRVELVEGRVGNIRIDGNRYIDSDYIAAWLKIDSGDLVDPRALEERLLRFNRVSQARITAALQPGERFGLTDFLLTLQEPQRNRLDLFLNNHGYASTGRTAGGLLFQHTGLAGRDDSLMLFLSRSEGAKVASASYEYPVNSHGTRVGVRAGLSETAIIDGPFAAIDSRSDSENAYLSISQPIWVGREWMLATRFGYGQHRTENHVSDVFLNRSDVTSTQLEINAQFNAPGRSFYASLTADKLRSEIQGTPVRESFTVWSGTWQFSQAWSERAHATLSGAWQYVREEGLPSSHLFQIGGHATVRGYEQGALAGDGGMFIRLQTNYQFLPGISVFGFYDRGLIDSSFKQPEELESVGAGLSWTIGRYLSAEAALGVPLKHVRPDQDSAGAYLRMVVHAF